MRLRCADWVVVLWCGVVRPKGRGNSNGLGVWAQAVSRGPTATMTHWQAMKRAAWRTRKRLVLF